MRFEYKVIPYMGQVKSNIFSREGPDKVARELEQVFNAMSVDGWEYVRTENIDILQQPGCLAVLIGQKTQMYTFNQLVFRRPVATP